MGFVFNQRTHTFTEEGRRAKKLQTHFEIYLEKLGVAWVGLNRFIMWRQTTYDKWEMTTDAQGKPTGKYGIVPKVRGVKGKDGDNNPSIFFQYNMATGIEEAETVGNLPVNAVIVFTTRIRNPVKALFFGGSWTVQIVAAIGALFREYVKDKTIETLREEKREGAGHLIAQIKGLSKDLLELFGVEIIDAQFVSFDPVKIEEMNKALRGVEIATLEAKAAEKRGEGKRREREEEAEGIRATVQAWGSDPFGASIAMAEAIKEAKPNVLGGKVLTSVPAERKIVER